MKIKVAVVHVALLLVAGLTDTVYYALWNTQRFSNRLGAGAKILRTMENMDNEKRGEVTLLVQDVIVASNDFFVFRNSRNFRTHLTMAMAQIDKPPDFYEMLANASNCEQTEQENRAVVAAYKKAFVENFTFLHTNK